MVPKFIDMEFNVIFSDWLFFSTLNFSVARKECEF